MEVFGIFFGVVAVISLLCSFGVITNPSADKELINVFGGVFVVLGLVSGIFFYNANKPEIANEVTEMSTLKTQVAELKSELDFIKNKPLYEKICKEYGNFIGKHYRLIGRDSCGIPNVRYDPLWNIQSQLKIMRKVKQLPQPLIVIEED